jgi:hypothetical protein
VPLKALLDKAELEPSARSALGHSAT